MRIVFMGTPDFAVPCLERLLADGHEISGVFTQPDKPKGRGYKLTPPPVKELALAHHLPVFQPTKLRDGQALAILRELAPTLIVVVAYGKLLPKELLELPKLGCVNVHGSLLPKYRGAAPIQWSVIHGDALSGVTTMYMAEGMDTGDMILSCSTPIGEEETSGELYERLAVLGAQTLSETVELLAAGTAPRIPQKEEDACSAPMLDKALAQIDWTKSALEIHNLIRGMSPWPIAHTVLEGGMLKIYKARLAQGSGSPGTLLDSKKWIVACGTGAIELLEIQTQGSKRMSAGDYLRGHKLAVGTCLK